MIETDGIIFDVDGTLWDSTPVVASAWTRAIRENGYPHRTVTADELRGLFGRKMDEIAQALMPEAQEDVRGRILALCCACEEEEIGRAREDLCYPGTRKTVRALAERFPLYIVSNCQTGYIELFLQQTGLAPCFADFVCYGMTGKDKADNIRLIAGRNGRKAPVYIGDTQRDFDAAREAGSSFVFASYGFGQVQGAPFSVKELSEVLSLVTKKM